MIEKFYAVDNGLDDLNCFSSSEVYFRMTEAKVPEDTVKNIMPYVQAMRPNDYFVIGGEEFGRVEIRCWQWY